MPGRVTAVEVTEGMCLLIRRILEHLNLWQERITKGLPPPAESIEPVIETMVCRSSDDGWGRYDDPAVTLN